MKNTITITQFTNTFETRGDIVAYIKSFSQGNKRTIDSGFFKWKGTNNVWCPTFAANHVFFAIWDYRKSPNLQDLNDLSDPSTFDGFQSKQFPIRVYLAGMDDFSYSKTFTNKTDAIKCLESFIQSPIDETLDSLGFVFSN